MTEIAKLLDTRSVNKAEIARKTATATPRLSELCLKSSTCLTAVERYLIALAIDVEPSVVLK